MRLLRVTATLSTPGVSGHDIHLDALLERAQLHRDGIDVDGMIDRLTPLDHFSRITLPIRSVDILGARVRLASGWRLSDDAQPARVHLTSRADAEDIERKARAYTPGSGAGRSRLVAREGVTARHIEWMAVGDRREVLRLLRLLSFVGSLRRGGYGVVDDWSVEAVEGDVVESVLVSAEGIALRALPPAWLSTPPASIGAWRSPYWHPEAQVRCALPGGPVSLQPAVRSACISAI